MQQARHKGTETEVAKLKTITRKLLRECAALEGKLRAAEARANHCSSGSRPI